MIIISVPLDKLQVAQLNVRKNKEDAERTTALEASILARGLIEPIIAHPIAKQKGHYAVYAGGKRLRALKNLQARGELGADYQAPVIVRDLPEGEIVEDSAAENIIRSPLRPYEVYAAYRDAEDRGISREDLAAHFGQRQIYVDQILRLGRLHPLIFGELEAGRLSDDQARAYAATEDQDLQLAVYSKLSKLPNAYQRGAREIRAEMKVGDNDAARLLAFVGRDAYEKAGGRWERDLFEEAEQRGRIVDEQLLARLVQDKLASLREQVLARSNRTLDFVDKPPTAGGQYGYTDYELKIDVRRSPLTEDQKARKVELEKLKADLEEVARDALLDKDGNRVPGLDEAEKDIDAQYAPVVAELAQIEDGRRFILPKLGDIVATLTIERDGRPALQFWYASRKTMKEALAAKSAAASGNDDGAMPTASGVTVPAPIQEAGLSSTTMVILKDLRRSIVRALLVEDAQRGGSVAQDYLVWSQLRGAIFLTEPESRGEIGAFTISAGMYDSMGASAEALPYLKQAPSHEIWEQAISLLKAQSFVTARNLGGAFIDFQAAAPEIKALAAAVVAGLSLKKSLNSEGLRIDVHDIVANATARSYPSALRRLLHPTAELLDLFPKAKRLGFVETMIDPKTFVAWGKKKAGELTTLCLQVFSGKSPSLKAGSTTEAKEWLPEQLLFGRPEVFEPAETADDRKAA